MVKRRERKSHSCSCVGVVYGGDCDDDNGIMMVFSYGNTCKNVCSQPHTGGEVQQNYHKSIHTEIFLTLFGCTRQIHGNAEAGV